MPVWSAFVDGLGQLLAHMSQYLEGSYGMAVLTLALAVRLLLLPLTLDSAEKAWRHQRQLKALQPQIEALRKRHAGHPLHQQQALADLYARHKIKPVPVSMLLTGAVQLPLGAGLFAAIRHGLAGAGPFLWIRSLARPDLGLALAVALLGYAAMLINPAMSQQAKTLLGLLPLLVSFLMVWHLAAGIGLYWAGASSVNVLQSALLRRRLRRS
jgi:YidC/Oxa1 family membrane protein insertase